jgi:Na+/proline symporter
MKALAILCAVFFGILMIPIAFGILGGLFGIVMGLFGAIFGIIAGIFGAIFGGIGSIFDWGNHDWYFGHHVNIFGVAAIVLLIILVSKSSRTRNKS